MTLSIIEDIMSGPTDRERERFAARLPRRYTIPVAIVIDLASPRGVHPSRILYARLRGATLRLVGNRRDVRLDAALTADAFFALSLKYGQDIALPVVGLTPKPIQLADGPVIVNQFPVGRDWATHRSCSTRFSINQVSYSAVSIARYACAGNVALAADKTLGPVWRREHVRSTDPEKVSIDNLYTPRYAFRVDRSPRRGHPV